MLEPTLEGDLRITEVSFGEQALCVFDALLQEPMVWSRSATVAKAAGEVTWGQAARCGNLCDRQLVAEMFAHIFLGILQLP